MAKLHLEDLRKLREEHKKVFRNKPGCTHYMITCAGTACQSNSGIDLYHALINEAEKQGVKDKVQIIETGCFGFCERGPIVKVLPENSFYVDVKPEDAADIIRQQVIEGHEVSRLLYHDAHEHERGSGESNIEFYKKQVRVALRNCGRINPEDIYEYIASGGTTADGAIAGGYESLEKVLFTMTSEEIINELKISGLRGRGGAGFPTWLKWDLTRKSPGDIKYVVCNADEGDPGAFMDRSTIEGDPHSIIEAMTICGKAIGANQGYVYIRAEYPLAVQRLEKALVDAKKYGLLGKDILGSGFDFDIEVRLGAGAFVCGEETALLRSLEGLRGMPTPKPPFPASQGLWGKPTVINNVETYANIPEILAKGGAWFASMGTADSKGSKVFALTGKVENSGLVEVPMGTTLREIIFEIGGGIRGGKKFKGVQTGGPSGGILDEACLDLPIDFETLTANGSMMGSGGMIVMDEDDCAIDVTRFYMEFSVEESCGKCSPCRIGTTQILKLLDKIAHGNGEESDIEQLETISKAMTRASLCMLGGTAANPVLSTLKLYRDEYLEHIHEKKCRAGKCKHLLRFEILAEKCIGCGICAKKCPADCISGEKKQPHTIDQAKCVKCGECLDACPKKVNAIVKR